MPWEEEKDLYVKKLKQITGGITKILDLKDNRVVTPEMTSSLLRLRSDAERLLPKLEKGEFEIAVVGVEKAGKSSFSNALIGLAALPTADERCTFTSTCIRPGKESFADVSFYSQQEFDRSFREKLEELGIPNAQLYTIETLSQERYEQLFENCDDTKKQLYERSLHRDIIATLRYRNELRQYVGSPKKRFSGGELKNPEFSAFITSPARAIAVKEVVIYSTELRDMPNAVMYDVPGFNSPTAMHEEQTLARMQAADAIIMVAKANEPTLTADVLKVFKKSDVDGAYLSEKLFVFANKADLATDLGKNKRTTYREWIDEYRILPNSTEGRDRIVFGSANACLSDTEARKKLQECGIPDGGIKILRDKLQTYYKTARFEVLKKRVNKILVDVKKIFDGTEMTGAAPYDNAERYQIVMALQKKLSGSICKQLEDLKAELNTEVQTERPLSTRVSERIRDLVTVERYEIQSEELDRFHKKKIGVGLAERPHTIDSDIREERFTQMYGDFMDEILSCTGSRHADVCKRILDIFLGAMRMSPGSREYARLEDEVKELCALDSDVDDGYYQSLIERFGRDVFEVQIKFPQGQERLGKFQEEAANFFSLGVFYRTSDNGDKLPYFKGTDSPLWRLLLYPENAAAASKDQVIQKLQQMTGLQNVGGTVSGLVDRLMTLKGRDTIATLEHAFRNFLSAGAKPEAVIFAAVKEILENVLDGYDGDSATLMEEILTGDRYQKDVSQKHGNYSYEQVRQEFSNDILALQMVLQNAVVPAVGIDKAFNARAAKLIEDIIKMLDDSRFERFVAKNAEIIEASEFGRMNEEEAQRNLDMAVMNEIQNILSKLDGGSDRNLT